MIEFSTARINKDKNYDGRFFFGVKTTGIFCRPSCPAPVAKEENVTYFGSVFEALDQNFVPCYRCRPDIELDYYTGSPEGNLLTSSALDLIYKGYLNTHTVFDLAKKLDISERHLRKLFIDNIGISPNKISLYHKAMFAKKMICNSNLPFTEISHASGFGSIRQLNETIKNTFQKSPTQIRKSLGIKPENGFSLLVKYNPPFNFTKLLEFLQPRAIPGVEIVTDKSYGRTFRTENECGSFYVTDNPLKNSLNISINNNDLTCFMEIYTKVRLMFDIDTNLDAISKVLAKSPFLFGENQKREIFRIPKSYSPFEFIIRAILGQQISVKAATTLAGRIARLGPQKSNDENIPFLFPTPEEMLELDLSQIGITKARRETIHAVAQSVVDGTLKLNRHQSFEEFHKSFCSIKGIGDWTAQYVGMRALGYSDCFPVTDLGILKAMNNNNQKLTNREMLDIAENWRPFRSYASFCLWEK